VIVNVHMTDGRTVFQLRNRRDLSKLIHREPDSDEHAVRAFVKWTPDSPWQPFRLTQIKRHSVAFVGSAVDAATALGLEEHDAAEVPAEQLLEADAPRERRLVEATPA
jgi:hypothetical protein